MKKFLYYLSAAGLVLAVFISWKTFPTWSLYLFNTPPDKESQELWGVFGDSFGALNTLFSGLAFTGIIVSIFLQSIELKETRNEIKNQGKQFEAQTEALNKQVFENTFFQLIHLHNEIIQSISVGHPGEKIGRWETSSGRAAFKELYVGKFGEGMFIHELGISEGEVPKDTDGYYTLFHEKYGNQLGHYFRNIYQILKFIEKSNVKDKKFYSNLLRAQLSSYELALLFFNCLSELGNEEFKPLVEKFEFFEHLPWMDFMSEEDIKMYSIQAYGKTNKKLISVHSNA